MFIPPLIDEIASILFPNSDTWKCEIKLIPKNNHISYGAFLIGKNAFNTYRYKITKVDEQPVFTCKPVFGSYLSKEMQVNKERFKDLEPSLVNTLLEIHYSEYRISPCQNEHIEPPDYLLPFYNISNESSLYPLIVKSSICQLYSSPMDFILGGLIADKYTGCDVTIRSLYQGESVEVLVDNELAKCSKGLSSFLKEHKISGSFSFRISTQPNLKSYSEVMKKLLPQYLLS